MVAQTWNPSAWEAEGGGPEVQGLTGLWEAPSQKKFRAYLFLSLFSWSYLVQGQFLHYAYGKLTKYKLGQARAFKCVFLESGV